RYEPVIHSIDTGYGIDCGNLAHRTESEILRNHSDRVLSEVARELLASGVTYEQYCSDVRFVRDSLEGQRAELLKRARKRDCACMYSLADHIGGLLPRLSFMHHYLKHHATFFALYDAEQAMLKRYAKELRLTDYDSHTFAHELHKAIMSYG